MALPADVKVGLPARAGVERCGASRTGAFCPNPVIKIAGVDITTTYALLETIEVFDRQNSDPNEAHLTVLPGLTVTPGQFLIVALGADQLSVRQFAGPITRITQRQESNRIVTDVSAEDAVWYLDRRVITAYFENASATNIIRSLILNNTNGITTVHVQANLPVIARFPIVNKRLSEILTDIGAQIGGAQWFLDEGTYGAIDLHFFQSSEANAPRPPDITNATVADYTSNLRIDTDLTQVRNRVTVEAKRTTCPIGTPDGTSASASSATIDYLIVGGGGGGGTVRNGGGGAGRVIPGSDVIGVGAFAVTVGSGGAAATAGSDSVFNGHTAKGGGRGSISGSVGGDGGSGGGGSNTNAGGSAQGTEGTGNAGGSGNFALSAAGGGGGGAGTVGGNASPLTGGPGGDGVSSSISGTPTYYGGGGGGNGDSSSGNGGAGGGGRGGAGGNPATNGAANTGGGGGAGDVGGGSGGAGGSGVVIIRYPTGAISATGGTITTAGGYTVHTFTSSGTFTVSSITSTSAPTTMTDIPVDDKSQIDAAGGTVRIGTQVTTYLSTAGPTVATGTNPPGSSLSADASIGATAIDVTNASTIFTSSPGWAKVGADQYVRFGGVSATQLTGLPSSGVGSLAAAVKSGTSITWMGSIVLSVTGVTFTPPLFKNSEVVQRVTANDTASQTALSAIEGGDGIHEVVIDGGDQLDVAGATALANAQLASLSNAIKTVSWTSHLWYLRSGMRQNFNLTPPAGNVVGSFAIQSVRIYGFDQVAPWRSRSVMAFPPRDIIAAPVQLAQLADLVGTTEGVS